MTTRLKRGNFRATATKIHGRQGKVPQHNKPRNHYTSAPAQASVAPLSAARSDAVHASGLVPYDLLIRSAGKLQKKYGKIRQINGWFS
jgi:hypothetical protein